MSVYDNFAKHFSQTRANTKIWNSVDHYIKNMVSNNAVILDAGCGSGKNMDLREDCLFYGIDNSEAMVSICFEKGYNVQLGSVTAIPFKDHTFDNVLCIAVIHHLQKHDRIKAIKELIRVCKINSTIMLQVWASTAIKDRVHRFIKINEQSDYNVMWKNKYDNTEYYRFYHMYQSAEELYHEVRQAEPSIKIISQQFESNNYIIIIQKQK